MHTILQTTTTTMTVENDTRECAVIKCFRVCMFANVCKGVMLGTSYTLNAFTESFQCTVCQWFPGPWRDATRRL